MMMPHKTSPPPSQCIKKQIITAARDDFLIFPFEISGYHHGEEILTILTITLLTRFHADLVAKLRTAIGVSRICVDSIISSF
jgi:hypothetical protein